MQNYLRLKIGPVIIFSLAVVVLLAGCYTDSDRTANANRAGGDAQFFVNAILEIEDPLFFSKDSDGIEKYDELKAQQKWGELYNKYKKLAESGDEKGFKYYLFIGFLAFSLNNAELSEAYSSDLIPLFNKDALTFLETLKELPFLVQSMGTYMNNYFGFEDKNADKKPDFLKNNKQLIMDILGTEDGVLFFSKFD